MNAVKPTAEDAEDALIDPPKRTDEEQVMLLMHVLKKLRKCNDPYLLHPLTACTDAPTSFDGILI